MLSDNSDNYNISKSENVNEYETNFSKTGNNYWPSGTVTIIGDWIVNGIDEKRLSMNNHIVKVFHFSRATIRNMSQFI